MKKPLQTFEAAWSDLERQHGAGKPQPKLLPTALSLRSVKLRPEVFQQRTIYKPGSDAHVRELAKHTQDMDAIVVWWDGKHWTCIDGHHRLAAFKSKGEPHMAVPVQVFEGSPDQALLKSASANTPDKLPMGRAEKANAAWRMVVVGAGSRAEIVKATGASDGTVAKMRRDMVKLEGSKVTGLGDMRWEAARRLAAGEAPRDWADPDWVGKEAKKLAALLSKALGAPRHRQVEIFEQALAMSAPKLVKDLRDHWRVEESEEE